MNIPNGATHVYELKDGGSVYLKCENKRWLGYCIESEEWKDVSTKTMSIAKIYIKEIPVGLDSINQPSHYTQGKVECIDAIESATVGKSGIEAVCVGNVIKYLWRYEQKGGKESVQKAQYYLSKLLEQMK